MNIKKIRAVAKNENDYKSMLKLLSDIPLFSRDENEVVLELLDLYQNNPNNRDYYFFATEEEMGNFSSFICFGSTPMTSGTYDLYWLGTSQKYEKQGLARSLVDFMISYLREHQGRIIRVETASKEAYSGTQAFYQRLNFKEEARLRDFYAPGDDLMMFTYHV